MFHLVTSAALIVGLGVANAQICGPAGFSIAGSASILPIADALKEAYLVECPTLDIVVEGGGSSVGAARVCAAEGQTSAVDIGDMSRAWQPDEATPTEEGYVYDCVFGDTSRSVIQIEVALDGITVAGSGGGTAASCMDVLGGLTIDQLRWIFSSYSETELEATGWDPSSVANSDGDSTTRNWSELDPSCDAVPIAIVGADSTSGTFEYFASTVFADFDSGETFDTSRGYIGYVEPEEIVTFIESQPSAVGYVGYAFYYDHGTDLYAAAIQNSDGEFVFPGADSIVDTTYKPLSRRLYMNLLNDPKSLENTTPFITFAFTPDGSDAIAGTGYIPIANPSEMIVRFPLSDNNDENVADSTTSAATTWNIRQVAGGAALLIAASFFLL